jgi:hypothetical protein
MISSGSTTDDLRGDGFNMVEARKMPENAEAREYFFQTSEMRDNLRTAIALLQEAHSPFESGSDADQEWLLNRSEFIAFLDFVHFGGPEPDGPSVPY